MLSSLAVWADANTNNNNNYTMRNFFMNTYTGVGLVITIVAMITLLIETTLAIILYGGGRSILTTLGTEGIMPNVVIDTCDYLWASLVIITYLCTLYPLFVYFIVRVDTIFELDITTDEEQD